jgi:hypothetical protein
LFQYIDFSFRWNKEDFKTTLYEPVSKTLLLRLIQEHLGVALTTGVVEGTASSRWRRHGSMWVWIMAFPLPKQTFLYAHYTVVGWGIIGKAPGETCLTTAIKMA